MTERLALPLQRAPTKLKDQQKKDKSTKMLQKDTFNGVSDTKAILTHSDLVSRWEKEGKGGSSWDFEEAWVKGKNTLWLLPLGVFSGRKQWLLAPQILFFVNQKKMLPLGRQNPMPHSEGHADALASRVEAGFQPSFLVLARHPCAVPTHLHTSLSMAQRRGKGERSRQRRIRKTP